MRTVSLALFFIIALLSQQICAKEASLDFGKIKESTPCVIRGNIVSIEEVKVEGKTLLPYNVEVMTLKKTGAVKGKEMYCDLLVGDKLHVVISKGLAQGAEEHPCVIPVSDGKQHVFYLEHVKGYFTPIDCRHWIDL